MRGISGSKGESNFVWRCKNCNVRGLSNTPSLFSTSHAWGGLYFLCGTKSSANPQLVSLLIPTL